MEAEIDSDECEVRTSELGTKHFWDSYYQRDLSTYRSTGDIGDTWFGSGISNKVIKWMTKSGKCRVSDKILEVGCGNGALLFALRKEGFENLTGFDYSEDAIVIANEHAQERGIHVRFEVSDMLKMKYDQEWDICVDKGTFDAITLNPDIVRQNLKKEYANKVGEILKTSGLFIIMSCNYTKSELEETFKEGFIVEELIPTTTFQFGGSEGRTVTALVMRKK